MRESLFQERGRRGDPKKVGMPWAISGELSFSLIKKLGMPLSFLGFGLLYKIDRNFRQGKQEACGYGLQADKTNATRG